jgi:hypothetical protein
LYSLTTSAAYAADSNVPKTAPKTPGDTGAVQSTPTQKPGFKPLAEGTKGAYVGGAITVCGVALQSGDFYIGLACAFLLVVEGIVINLISEFYEIKKIGPTGAFKPPFRSYYNWCIRFDLIIFFILVNWNFYYTTYLLEISLLNVETNKINREEFSFKQPKIIVSDIIHKFSPYI